MTSITITRALTELKTLDKRIQRAIQEGVFVSFEGQLHKPHPDVADAKSKYQQITDLIERRRKLKSLLTVSNATTKVTICEMEMTVAEAIEMKSSIKHKKTLLSTLKSQYASAVSEVERTNEYQRRQLQQRSQDKESGVPLDFFTEYMKINGVQLKDPLNIKHRINELESFITEFESQVDHVLSEKNATTHIEIDA